MSLRERERGIAAERAKDGHIDARHCRSNHLFMRLTANAIDENARKTDVLVIHTKAERGCRGRCSYRLCVNHEQYGRVERLCNRRR